MGGKVAAEMADTHCRNCGFQLWVPARKYCAQCGQRTQLNVPTVREFIHEFAGHYVAFDGKLFHTLKLLLFFPGRLSREYLAGRRQQYIGPLKLYLTFSLIFFIAFKFAIVPQTPKQTVQGSQAAIAKYTATPNVSQAPVDLKEPPLIRAMVPAIREYGAYAMFFLIPVFVVFTRVLYSRRTLNFGSHLVFAFHLHAVLFLLLSIAMLLPAKLWVAGVTFAILAMYLVTAMQVMFAGRRILTIVRTLFLLFLYSSTLMLAVLIIAGVAQETLKL